MPDPMFSTEALKKGILDLQKNIMVFEEAISKERERIVEYQNMISVLEEKKTQARIAKALEQNINAGG